MTVFRNKQRGNRWAYDFELNKERYRGYCLRPDGQPAKTETEARDAETRVRDRARAEQGMAKSGIRADSYPLASAIHLHRSRQVDSSTSHVKSLQRIGAELMRFFGLEKPIAAITPEDIEAYRAFCIAQKRKVWVGGPRKITDADHGNPRLWRETGRPRSASEVNHCLDVLRCAFNAAHKVRDPITGQSVLPFPIEIDPVFDATRAPTPMPEDELARRLEAAPPWTQETALLARLFGCRLTEAVTVELRHMDHQERCLRFLGSEAKSGRDEPLYGGAAGWTLLERLAAQARRRGATRLITWPGSGWARRVARGEIPADDARDEDGRSIWRPLKSIATSWRGSAKRAGVEHPHRYHDLRAAYITDIDRVAGPTATRLLARHASMATTQRYIGLQDSELGRAANKAAKRRARLRVVK